MATTLTIYRGDAASFDVVLTLDDSPINLTDYLAFFTVKKKMTDPDSSAVVRKNSDTAPSGSSGGINVTDAAAGKMTIALLHDDTKTLLGGSYYYGINVVNRADAALVYTLMEGNFVVNLDIGIRTSGDPT